MKVNDTAEFPAQAAQEVENSNDGSTVENLSGNLQQGDDSSDSSDGLGDDISIRRKKRVQTFLDCDSETEDTNNLCNDDRTNPPVGSEGSNDDGSVFKNVSSKSRIRRVSSGSDSDCNEKSSDKVALKNDEQQSRMKSKRNKMTQKFKSLLTSRAKQQEPEMETRNVSEVEKEPPEDKHTESSGMSSDEESSIDKIRQIIKERTVLLKSTIYDPDTSDEERHPANQIQKKKQRKSTKLTSPQVVRMSAKQAVENMQKIKSESNRMLREKEVSLPYHRPKALALKDILSRRRPAVSSDGKALPIKMNEDQLKQYVLTLEQRQKEMMELCKSDTDEEDTQSTEKNEDLPSNNDSMYDELVKTNETLINVDPSIDNNDAIGVENLSPSINLTESSTHENSCNKQNKTEINDAVDNYDDGDKPVYANSVEKVFEEIPSNIINCSNDNNLNDNAAKSLPNAALESNTSAEMEIVYNDSLDDTNVAAATVIDKDSNVIEDKPLDNTEDSKVHTDSTNAEFSSLKVGLESDGLVNSEQQNSKVRTESDSQMISLHYDTEPLDIEKGGVLENTGNEVSNIPSKTSEDVELYGNDEENNLNDFSDDDINMEDIDNLIENAEILSQSRVDNLDSPLLVRDHLPLNIRPKLTGAPGMVINLDGTDPFAPKKLTGVELLKQRFTYFAKLKTPEELEREREKRTQPGLQHLKLKQVLEEEIADQQSLEWSKRLEDAKKHQMEMDAVRGDAEDDIDNIEAKLGETEEVAKEISSESEEEEEEESNEVKEKPRKRNAMIADEADESDCDDLEDTEAQDCNEDNDVENDNVDANDVEADDDENSDDEETNDESSEESEDDTELDKTNQKKGRILKAFEDSDDEDLPTKLQHNLAVHKESNETNEKTSKLEETHVAPLIGDTQDDELQLAQRHKSFSDDLFTSQESAELSKQNPTNKSKDNSSDDKALVTQTFSILNTGDDVQPESTMDLPVSDSLVGLSVTEFREDGTLDHVVCSGSFSQSLVVSQYTQQSQGFGEDVFALCTGKFYDNPFVTQSQNDRLETMSKISNTGLKRNIDNVNDKMMRDATAIDVDKTAQIKEINADIGRNISQDDEMTDTITIQTTEDMQYNKGNRNVEMVEDKNLLNSILDELNDPEFEKLKPNKYFIDNGSQNKENKRDISNSQIKKKFIIDSDDECKGAADGVIEKKKKLKKRKLKQRALHISDDEEEASDKEMDDEMSETENELEGAEREVDYDSEENEVVVDAESRKKMRKAPDFFEHEAELSSEDEWAGSGDEDEAGMDRMEREAGDDDTFHQGRLRRELAHIHMRDVLDQDKREVRLIQELLFEDGDLGGGHRQRKFRWKNADGEEETDATHELADTQEEEFESEEQWRKQRHEREMFLKDMKKTDGTNDSLNVSISRNSIIKANLSSKSISSLLEVNISNAENIESPAPLVEKTVKDIPSPKKPFIMHKQNYHNSLLMRGRGALARLAALATPLAADDDAPRVAVGASCNSRFVFTALPTAEEKPKTIKRKAVANAGTPRLVKKMRTEEIEKASKSSLIDYLNT